MKKVVSIFLLATLHFQSCVVYQKMPVPIKEAYERGSGVKIISKLGDRFIFNGIYVKDSIYYGVKGDNLVRLDTTQISGIYLQDNKKTKKAKNRGKVVPIVVVVYVVAAVAAVLTVLWILSLFQ